MEGLELVHTFVSSKDDWDQYEGLQWYATAEYARSHPDDPDLPELLERVTKAKGVYLRWGRDTLGWAIYVFRNRPPQSHPAAVSGNSSVSRLIDFRRDKLDHLAVPSTAS